MNSNVELVNRIMGKARLTKPVDADTQDFIHQSKRRVMKDIFKRSGEYGLMVGMVSFVYFALKKMGISLSITKCAVAVATAMAVTGASLSTGVYYTARYIKSVIDKKAIEEKVDTDSVKTGETTDASTITKNAVERKDEPVIEKDPPAVVQARIGVQPFQRVNTDRATSYRIANTIARGLTAAKGGGRIINFAGGAGKKAVGRMVIGSVELLDGSYTVTAKVVSVDTAKILFFTSETADSEADIDAVCNKISRQIANEIK